MLYACCKQVNSKLLLSQNFHVYLLYSCKIISVHFRLPHQKSKLIIGRVYLFWLKSSLSREMTCLILDKFTTELD